MKLKNLLTTRIILIAMTFVHTVDCVNAQVSGSEIPFFLANEMNIDAGAFKALRGEYKEMSYSNEGDSSLVGYIMIDLDHSQDWGSPSFIVNWHRTSGIASGNDIVVTNNSLGVKMRYFPSSGFPGGLITENHSYKSHVDVMFSHPNRLPELDTVTFTFAATNEKYRFNQVYRKEKTYENTHNVIVWPYVLAAIDWSKNKDFILPGFSAFGLSEYYYRIIYQGEKTIFDLEGNKHIVSKVVGIRSDSIEKLRNVSLSDPAPRAVYYVSDRPPYYYAKEDYRRIVDGKPVLTGTETLIGFQLLKYSLGNFQRAMLDLSRDRLKPFKAQMPWIKD